MLQRPAVQRLLVKQTPAAPASPMMPCAETAALVTDLMNAGVSMHQLHLKVTGQGSFAAHKALGEFYEAIQDHADSIAEQYQGARESLLDMPSPPHVKLDSVESAIEMLRDLTVKVNALQKIMPFTEIVNQLDEVKSLIDSTKYKLLFLS